MTKHTTVHADKLARIRAEQEAALLAGREARRAAIRAQIVADQKSGAKRDAN